MAIMPVRVVMKTTVAVLATIVSCAAMRLPSYATTILAIVGQNKITVASDGIVTGQSADDGAPIRVRNCKIRCVEYLCFAAAGRYGNATIGYDIWQLAMSVIERTKTPKDASTQLSALLSPLLTRLV